ncbi:hypothetical protein ACIBEA_43150 [Streptomyces sp. NPDC051555]|uniref:hypothetical protein n=1 Tax=Streptomyces sp. NPDC051555 TaxID=3365657 RepID=UPI0037A0CB10
MIALAVTPALLWWLDTGIDELTTAEGAAGLLPAIATVAYLAYQSAGSVRSEQRGIADSARELASAATRLDDQAQLSRAADDLGTALLSAFSPFKTRLIPRRAAVGLARQVREEAQAAEGLTPAPLRVVQVRPPCLARAAALLQPGVRSCRVTGLG